MGFDCPVIQYAGKIKEITIGRGENALTLGGETAYPFYLFEGEMPHPPEIALEVYDSKPENWPAGEETILKDVLADPLAWARAGVDKLQARAVCLRLVGTDPNGLNKSAQEAADLVKKMAEAITVPLLVWGSENEEKDAEVLSLVAEAGQGKNLTLGPVTEKNYKKIGAAAIAYNHTVVAATPIDVNLAKQLNILLADLGVPGDRLLIDTNVGGSSLGYGLEYTYTVMERVRQAALTQGDEKLQYPLVVNCATDIWKKKETQTAPEENPAMGNTQKRGIMLETITAVTLLLAGADLVVMRHPEAVRMVCDLRDKLLAENK